MPHSDLPNKQTQLSSAESVAIVQPDKQISSKTKSTFLSYRIFSWGVLLLSIVFFLLVVMFATLQWFVLPRSHSFFNDFSKQLYQKEGIRLSAKKIEGSFSLLNPRLIISNIEVILTPGAIPIKAKKIDVQLSWRIFIGQVNIHHFHIDEVDISLQRQKDGTIVLSGSNEKLLPEPKTDTDNMSNESVTKWLDWLFKQKRVWVNNAVIHWSDNSAILKKPIIWDINSSFWIEQHYDQTQLHARVNFPKEVADIMRIDGKFKTKNLSAINWADNVGEMAINVLRADWSKLAYLLPDKQKWTGVTEASVWWMGNGIHDSRLTIELTAENLEWKLFPLKVKSAGGIIYGIIRDGQLRLNTEKFLLNTNAGKAPLPTKIQLSLSPKGGLQNGEVILPTIKLTQAKRLLKSFVQWIPNISTLDKLNPTGSLLDSRFIFSLPSVKNQSLDYQFNTRLSNVSWKGFDALPGATNLSGQLIATPNKGSFLFNGKNMVVDIPSIMHERLLKIGKLDGALHWNILPSKKNAGDKTQDFTLQFAPIRLINDDADLEIEGSFKSINGQSLIDIHGLLLNGNGRSAWRYLPKVVSASAKDWLAESLVGGTSPIVKLVLRGNIDNFPFKPSKSLNPTEAEVFQVLVPIRDARMKFQPDWPSVDGAEGLLRFDSNRMDILITKGTLSGANAKGTRVVIEELKKPVLKITGRAEGDINQFKTFMLNSPLRDVIPSLEKANAKGASILDLSLTIPIANAKHGTKVSGTLRSSHKKFSLNPALPAFFNVTQETKFDSRGVVAINAKGFWLGAPFKLSTTERGEVALSTENIEANTLKNTAEIFHPWMNALTGSLKLSGGLSFNKGFGLKLVIDTTRLASSLPSPFSKDFGVNWPINMNLQSSPKNPSLFGMELPNKALRLGIRLTPTDKKGIGLESLHNRDIVAEIISEGGKAADITTSPPILELLAEWPQPTKTNQGVAPLILLRVQDPSTPSSKPFATSYDEIANPAINNKAYTEHHKDGLYLEAQVPTWDLWEWLPWLSNLAPKKASPSQIAFRHGEFKADTISFGKIKLSDVSGTLHPPAFNENIPDKLAEGWRAYLDSKYSKSYVDWRSLPFPENPEKGEKLLLSSPASENDFDEASAIPESYLAVYANFNRLDIAPLIDTPAATPSISAKNLAATKEKAVATKNPKKIVRKNFPKIDIYVNSLYYKDLLLGEMIASGEPTHDSYKLTHIRIKDNESIIWGNGVSSFKSNQTQLRLTAEVKSLGKKILAFTGKKQIAEAKLDANAIFTWPGHLTDFALATANGEVELSLTKGRFLEIEPGVGRLVGLLSLQSILRRITFDFSDSLSKGFSFDKIHGNIKLVNGKMNSRNFKIDSTAAKILMQGEIDLNKEKQDLEILILPDITGGIATGIAFLVNPLSGVVTWIAQQVIGSPLDYAFAKKINVTGTWKEPEVKEVPYSVGDISTTSTNGKPRPANTTHTNEFFRPPNKNERDLKNLYSNYPDGFRAECR